VKVAFVGAFAVRLADRVKAHLPLACDVILADEAAIVSRIPEVDVVVTLELMKPTAILVNVARAEIIDESALYHALARRTIAGAALDVWYQYPAGPGPTCPSSHPFHELPNVLMTPHVAGWTEGTLEARAQLIAENIGRVARDEAPLNLIPPPVGS
jgi:phosphoglycerate dehydrogenase-like enzyme